MLGYADAGQAGEGATGAAGEHGNGGVQGKDARGLQGGGRQQIGQAAGAAAGAAAGPAEHGGHAEAVITCVMWLSRGQYLDGDIL